MSERAAAARAAIRLWKSEGRLGSVVAVALVVVFFGPILYRFLKQK